MILKEVDFQLSFILASAKEYGSGGQFYGIKCDLENDEEIRYCPKNHSIENTFEIPKIRAMFETIKNHPDLGHVDICVNNAGKYY